LYDTKKQQYLLRGYILAFEQGLGKTFTSLSLMHCLGKDAVVVIAPKSTLKTVWRNEIGEIFKSKQDVWVVGDPPKKARFYILNYESIDKVSKVIQYIKLTNKIGIIVDECHNFKNAAAKRVTQLLALSKITKCEDTLLMSGTPIKALGSEMIPSLELIDPFFDEQAKEIYKKVFGMNRVIALDVMKNRLGIMMHRKMKSEVLSLPPKTYKEVKIKFSGSDKYTLDSVKIELMKFISERKNHYEKNYKLYSKMYYECIDYVKPKLKNSPEFQDYMKTIKILKKKGYNRYDQEMIRRVKQANEYEKNVIRPMLPPDLKRKFDKSKAVIKYVDLKIMGEAIGGLLNNLRAEMFSKMIENSPICHIINQSLKKTVCFTTYVDVVRSCVGYVDKVCGVEPVTVFGETSANVTKTLKVFKQNPQVNPLIATIQTLSTGVTVVEANTVIFLNKPWRHADQMQAEDRVHRIGQDTDVFIYTFVLDTGSKPNLSTRMEDIVNWSKEMFEGIVGTDDVKKSNRLFRRLLKKEK